MGRPAARAGHGLFAHLVVAFSARFHHTRTFRETYNGNSADVETYVVQRHPRIDFLYNDGKTWYPVPP
jgi:hypothetical protein